MRITKKALSIVLAIMMVASMMVVGVVSASAAGENFEVVALGTDATGAVGDQFVDINDAINAAGDNGEIKLITDMEFDGNSGYIFVSANKSITFDLNGHKIVANQTMGINLSSVLPGVYTFTVKDSSAAQTGEIIASSKPGYSGLACISGNTGREIVVESGTFTCDTKALYVSGKGATINGGTFNGDVDAHAPVEINNGTVNGDVTVSGSAFYFDSGWTSHSDSTTADITNSTVNGDIVQAAASNAITISGGTISGAVVPAEGSDSVTVTGNDTIESNGKIFVVPAGTAEGAVAVVNGHAYTSFQDAYTAAQDGDTITLLADITATTTNIAVDKDLTIDFGSYTYTAAKWPFENYATLTLNGTTGGITTPRGIIDNYGTLIVNGGVYNETDYKYPAIWNNSGSELIFNGGTINAANAAIRSDNGTETTINDGQLNSTSSYKIDNTYYSYTVNCQPGSTTTVNGGTITGVHGGIVATGNGVDLTTIVINDATITTHHSELGNDAHYPIYVSGNNTSVTVKGGTFSGPRAAAMIDDNDIGLTENTALIIEGGTFTSPANVQAVTRSQNDSYPEVSGGTFSSEVPVEYCAEDFFPVADGNGNYTVDDITAPTVVSNNANGENFGLDNVAFTTGKILGVQRKGYNAEFTSESSQEDIYGRNIRFVAVIDKELLDAAEDYGFVVAKADATKNSEDRTCANTEFGNMKYNGTNGEKTLSALGTYNTLCGQQYGDPTVPSDYKYVTCAVNSVEDGKKIVARFYVKVNGKVYYMDYTNGTGTYSGCVAGINAYGDIY